MVLHLLRHAEAEDVSSSGRDADRELTEAGIKRMRVVARAIAKLEPAYDAVLISPLSRARQTADPVAEACRFPGSLTVTNALLPNASPEEILDELDQLGCRSALLVGHQPHLGRLIGRLLTGRDGVEVPMKKAAFAGFELPGGAFDRAELKLYLPPRLLEKLA